MSELISKNDNRATIRWKLLTGASVLVLAASSIGVARAEDSAQPQVWIELGEQFNRLEDNQEVFAPAFLAQTPSIFSPQQKFERPPRYGFDETGAITFQPEDSNWKFSAAISYGRSGSNKHVHQQTYPVSYPLYFYTFHRFIRTMSPIAARFADTRSKQTESHSIIDFTAGKDVGLGLFGHDVSSTVSLGVRFAQFSSRSRASLKADPDWRFAYKYVTYPSFALSHSKIPQGQPYHSFAGDFRATRSFHGIGPSLSWKSSAPIAGNAQNGEITIDWGVNVATLFGRQKTRTHHQSTGRFHGYGTLFNVHPGVHPITYQSPSTPDHTRSRNVTVPNVGGFAGLSYNYANAKISLGYKVDWFFNAIDGGIDAAKKEDRGFYGPYASISIGIGD